jgi:hypothetical protein
MHGGDAARIEPIARKIERGTIPDLEPEHIDIESPATLEVLRLDGEVL